MIEKTVYGPIEYLAPDDELQAKLELAGIKMPRVPFITHVFLEEVVGDDLDSLVQSANYAGCFAVPAEVSDQGSVQIDITYALRKAEAVRPNFHITFITEYGDADPAERLLQFESMHILHDVPLNRKLDIAADVLGGLVPNRKNTSDSA